MKSFEFNFYQENLFNFNEEKTLLDSSSYENKHQNDTAEWYEKLNKVSYDYREKLYKIDFINECQAKANEEYLLDEENWSILNNTICNDHDDIKALKQTVNSEKTIVSSPRTEKNLEICSSQMENGYSYFKNYSKIEIESFEREAIKEHKTKANSSSIINSSLFDDFIPIESSIVRDSDTLMNSNKNEPVGRRWGRELDRKAFEYLNIELAKVGMSIDKFLFDPEVKIDDSKNNRILCKFRLSLVKRIIYKYGWHKTTYCMFKRLRKIASNQEFSFRELKLLKRVVKQQRREKAFDIEKLSFLLPGKLHETIRNASKEILKVDICPF